ncbi:MAG: M1 family aminopeptidase, partial [candidate division Zixibacteria bacterium]|nr:M1 family aminopeptidase [candidate division Zixibacteria bacterium]
MLAVVPLIAIVAFASIAVASDNKGAFPSIGGKFKSKAMAIAVHDAVIDYGRAIQVVLEDGQLYRRPEGRSFDFFFIGNGRVDLMDSTGMENSWYDRFHNAKSVPFGSAYICGRNIPALLQLDSTPWAEGKITAPYWQKLQFLLDAPDKYYGVSLPGELGLWSDREPMPLPVWMDLEISPEEQITIMLSPEITEQLQIYFLDKKFDAPYLLGGYSLDKTIFSRPVELDSTQIAVRLKESGGIEAAATLFLEADSDRRGVMFNLPFLFTVDSVRDDLGHRLDFIKKLRRSNLYISRAEGQDALPERMTVFYRGKFAAGRGGADYPVNMTSWFPALPRRALGGYTITYTLHKALALISVGKKIDERIERDQRIVTYRADNDVSYVSFAAGVYDTLKDSVKGIPLTLYIRKEDNQGVFNRSIPRAVMNDIKESFAFFYDRFGPPLATQLEIVDQPLFSGQSSPGLIHLSSVSFETEKDQARFRAHEVAHQWWGHTVTPRTFRDMWLSEGLAEYSAALYLLEQKKDTTAWRELVDNWRRLIIQEGKIAGSYSRGYRAGPIIMGVRFLQSYSPGDYVALVYAKAAYMLQMLRFEIDGPAYRTDFSSAVLADYLRANRGGQAGSVDFINAARHYLGPRRTQPFFDQWL